MAGDWASGWTRLDASIAGGARFDDSADGAISKDGTVFAQVGYTMDEGPDLRISRDTGHNWTSAGLVPLLAPWTVNAELRLSVAMDGDGSAFAVTVTEDNQNRTQVLLSEDRGASWRVGWTSTPGLPQRPAVTIAKDTGRVFILQGDRLHSAGRHETNWAILRIPDASQLWWDETTLSASDDGQTLLVMASITPTCFLSTDGGARWTRVRWPGDVPVPARLRGAAVSGDGRKLVVTFNTDPEQPVQSGLLVSEDQGGIWRYVPMSLSGPFGHLSPVALSTDGLRILVANGPSWEWEAAPFGPSRFSPDGGTTWVDSGGVLPDGMHWAAMSGGGGVQLLGGRRWVGTWVNGVEYLPTASWLPRPQGDVELTGDRILRFEIYASGGGLSYQWRRDGIDLEEAPGRTGTRTPALVLSPATEKDLGRYSVRVSNSVGTIEAEVWVLDVEPPTIWGHRQTGSEAFVEGARLEFDVDVHEGLLDFQWRRNGIDLVDGDGVSGTRTETLLIESCRPEHLGEYSVVVRNPRGSVQRVVGRVSLSAPQVIGFRQVGGPGVHLGDPVRLELWAGGGGVTLQWMKDGIPLGDPVSASGGITKSVVLNAVQISDLGRYWAVLSNHLGVTETPVFPVHRAIWEQVRTIEEVAGGRSISVAGDGRRLLISSPSSFLHSVDGGVNWTVGGTGGESGPGLRGLLLDPPGHWLLAKLGKPHLLMRTEDGGVGWQRLPDLEEPDWSLHAVDVSADGRALVAICDRGISRLRYSVDGGRNWASVPSFPASGLYRSPVGVAVSRDGRVLAGLQNEYDRDWRSVTYLSFDQGTNWVREVVSSSGWGTALSMTSEGGQLVCLAEGRLYARTGVGGGWRALPISGLAPVAPCVSDGGRRIHAVQTVRGSELGQIVQSSDGGQTWRWSGSLAARWVGLGCSADGSVVYGLSDRGLFRSPDPRTGTAATVSTRAVLAASGPSVVGTGEPFRTYSLNYSSRLNEGIWKPDGAVVSDDQGTFRLDMPASGEAGFWLLRD